MDYTEYMAQFGWEEFDLELYGKVLPDYYDTMYLDGYTPEQILEALSRTMTKRDLARQWEQEAISDIKITSEVRVKK